MNLLVLAIFLIARRIAAQSTTSLYNDLEVTTDTIKLTTFPSILIPKLTTNLGVLKNEDPPSVVPTIPPSDLPGLFNSSDSLMQPSELSSPSNSSDSSNQQSLPTISPTVSQTNSSSDQAEQSLSRSEQPNESLTSAIQTSSIRSETIRNGTIRITTVEIRKANQTLMSTIMLRVHSVLQYTSNFSRQAVIPYVYMAKLQADGLYRQIADSTFLQNYVSNVFQTLVNDVMNQECNAVTTMLNYVLVPAIDAHGSNYLTARSRELTDGVSRWHNALQRWSSSLSSMFNQIAEMKFEDCGQRLLCSLGRAKYEAVREEPRMNRAKIIQFVNNLFNMPMLEKRLRPNYSLARQLGASGGDCGTLSSNCIINFDTIFDLVKQLF